MKTLAFDTTTGFCSVMLTDNQNVRDVFCEPLVFGQSELLMVKIKEMLDAACWHVRDLDLVAVCTGPGSYTGLRSSIAVARSFGLASPKTTIAGVNAFDVYAKGLPADKRADLNAVIVETKREDFYVAYYNKDLKVLEKGKTAFAQDIILDIGNKRVSLCGDGVSRFLSLTNGLNTEHAVCDEKPSVETLGSIASERFAAGSVDFPHPVYLKSADICVK